MSVEVDGTDGLAKAGLAKETGRSAGKIGISIVIAMGLGYVFVVLCGRFFLSPSDYAVFLTFWGFLMGIGSALSPLEQELSRQSAVAALDGGRVGKSALRAVAVCVAVVVIVGLLSMIPPVNTKLFGDHFVLSVIVLVGGISFACQFGVRGLLIGQHQVKHFSWLVIAEAAVRAVVLGGLFLASLTHLVPLALAAAAGSLAWLIFTHPAAKLVDPHVDGESWRPISGRILLLMAAAGLQASVITGYPALVKLLAPAVDGNRIGGLFALLQIARVPLLLLAPLQALAVPLVIRLSSSQDGRHRLRKLMALGTLGALALAVVGAVVGLLIGPWTVRSLFGSGYQVEGWWAAGLVWSSVLLIPMQLLAAVLVARTQANKVLATWAVVAAAAALVLLFFPGDTVLRAVIGLAVGPTLGLAVVVGFVLRRAPATASGNTQVTRR
jgi:O-antigen/teichoic acid export membrane protein